MCQSLIKTLRLGLSWENEESEEENVVLIDSEMEEISRVRLTPNTKESKISASMTAASGAVPNLGSSHNEKMSSL